MDHNMPILQIKDLPAFVNESYVIPRQTNNPYECFAYAELIRTALQNEEVSVSSTWMYCFIRVKRA